jgi:hypothetical protein
MVNLSSFMGRNVRQETGLARTVPATLQRGGHTLDKGQSAVRHGLVPKSILVAVTSLLLAGPALGAEPRPFGSKGQLLLAGGLVADRINAGEAAQLRILGSAGVRGFVIEALAAGVEVTVEHQSGDEQNLTGLGGVVSFGFASRLGDAVVFPQVLAGLQRTAVDATRAKVTRVFVGVFVPLVAQAGRAFLEVGPQALFDVASSLTSPAFAGQDMPKATLVGVRANLGVAF